MQRLGHLVRVARTERQAIEAVKEARPGLVLADIQLADGSSGLDAVNEFLQIVSVPVIFVTAFPERLLTGTKPEPTSLSAGPFNPEAVEGCHQPGTVLRRTRALSKLIAILLVLASVVDRLIKVNSDVEIRLCPAALSCRFFWGCARPTRVRWAGTYL